MIFIIGNLYLYVIYLGYFLAVFICLLETGSHCQAGFKLTL